MDNPSERNLAEFEKDEREFREWADNPELYWPNEATLEAASRVWHAACATQAEREKAVKAATGHDYDLIESIVELVLDYEADFDRRKLVDSIRALITPDRQLALDRHDAETREKVLGQIRALLAKGRVEYSRDHGEPDPTPAFPLQFVLPNKNYVELLDTIDALKSAIQEAEK